MKKTVYIVLLLGTAAFGQHNSGADCLACHTEAAIGGTVFQYGEEAAPTEGVRFTLLGPDSSLVLLDASDRNGNIFSGAVPPGACHGS